LIDFSTRVPHGRAIKKWKPDFLEIHNLNVDFGRAYGNCINLYYF
jgi:hypothetical protein